MSNTVIVIGTGEVGGHALEFLARTPSINRLVVIDINEKKALEKVACARYGAMMEGFYPKIELEVADVFDVDRVAGIIRKANPDAILNTASLQSWWVVYQLPEKYLDPIHEACIGPWLPMHLAPSIRVMQAVKLANCPAKVVSLPFPDAVNPILKTMNLAPTVGAGNLDELVPPLQFYVAQKLGVPPQAVDIYFIGHHFHNDAVLGFRSLRGSPYYLKIIVDGRDVTDQFPAEESFLASTQVWPEGKADSSIIASSAVKNVLAILNDSDLRTHAPGPSGLPGGYPVRLSAHGADVVLPVDITLEEAVAINVEAQRHDGIESIAEDGTVVFTEKSYGIMKDIMGYDCRKLSVQDVDEAAKELKKAFSQLWEKANRER